MTEEIAELKKEIAELKAELLKVTTLAKELVIQANSGLQTEFKGYRTASHMLSPELKEAMQARKP